jgi:hypothetical protein
MDDRRRHVVPVAKHPETPSRNKRRSTMAATLTLTHKAIGVEVRAGRMTSCSTESVPDRSKYDTIEIPLEPGRHTLQVRTGRNSSRTHTFDAADGALVAFRCTGKRILPIFLAPFIVPSLGLSLKRE